MRKSILTLTSLSLIAPLLAFAVTLSPNEGVVGSSNNDNVLIQSYADGATSSLWAFNTDTGANLSGSSAALVGTLSSAGLEIPVRVVGTFECFNDFGENYCLYDYSFTPVGSYSIIELDSTGGCTGFTYTACLAAGSFVSESIWSMRNSFMFSVPTSTADSLTATITDAFADPGLLLVIVVAAGLPLAFWAIRRVIGLVPKGR